MESAFDPRASGPLLPIVEQNDPYYYELRAKELIAEAQMCLPTTMMLTPNNLQLEQYHLKITQAIGLLALARVKRGLSREGAPKP